jgi:hypothetical protein
MAPDEADKRGLLQGKSKNFRERVAPVAAPK